MKSLAYLKKEINKLRSELSNLTSKTKTQIPDNPVDYAKLKNINLTSQQEEVLNACVTPPYSVLVRSAHAVGKTHLLSILANWFYDYHNECVILCTAPTQLSLKDNLFKEIRRLRPNDPDWLPKATRLQASNEKMLVGYTSSSGESFQGRHSENMLIIFDECAGIDVELFERMRTMVERNRKNHIFCGVFNPYDISSYVYTEECSGRNTVISLSALDHPNIVNKQNVIKGAISYTTIKDRIDASCRLVEEDDPDKQKAFLFDGKYYLTDDPLFESQVLGNWPSRSINSVWSDLLIQQINKDVVIDDNHLIQLGVDPARFGDDATCIAVRKAYSLIHIEQHHGWSLRQTEKRIKELCNKYAPNGQRPQDVPVNIDAAGLGSGLCEMGGTGEYRYSFIEVNSANKSHWEGEFVNIRSELWFNSADLASEGVINIQSSVPEDMKAKLFNDLKSPVFSLDALQRRVVEPKHVTKKRLKKSPDLADAFNLAYFLPPKPRYLEKVTGRV